MRSFNNLSLNGLMCNNPADKERASSREQLGVRRD
jgi:uncharacterized pyridoxal phosphate-containing UPF0001 family protein